MVLVHLLVTKKETVNKIADWLLKVSQAVSVEIDWTREHYILEGGEIVKETVHKLTFITKAANFTSIEKSIQFEHGDQLKELYSVPVIYQNWNAVKQIVSE
ncbi:MAG: hypothetical protein ACI9IP_001835 [Arcticibacterium sp.]|jgi:uncharacterized protein involved in tolerance to divalent cations